uniref:Uncharacterized protein n=1 Tax=Vespula pensylvanica TaxID=30213 RepID=A0A834JLI3_VESPE|nr:hypothetical protein H0235_017561 [Vespula pensylvanica]
MATNASLMAVDARRVRVEPFSLLKTTGHGRLCNFNCVLTTVQRSKATTCAFRGKLHQESFPLRADYGDIQDTSSNLSLQEAKLFPLVVVEELLTPLEEVKRNMSDQREEAKENARGKAADISSKLEADIFRSRFAVST